jgi:hypothetical protein
MRPKEEDNNAIIMRLNCRISSEVSKPLRCTLHSYCTRINEDAKKSKSYLSKSYLSKIYLRIKTDTLLPPLYPKLWISLKSQKPAGLKIL